MFFDGEDKTNSKPREKKEKGKNRMIAQMCYNVFELASFSTTHSFPCEKSAAKDYICDNDV